jgi:hypothetical protein
LSIKAFRWAKGWIADPGTPLKTFDAFVLVMIADHYNDDARRAWPKIATLAYETRLSKSSVKRSIARLQELGLLEIEHWFLNSNSRHQLANRYCLPLFDTRSTASPGPVYAEWDLAGHPEGFPEEGPEIVMATATITREEKWGAPVDKSLALTPWGPR